jgi:hypothetical protein
MPRLIAVVNTGDTEITVVVVTTCGVLGAVVSGAVGAVVSSSDVPGTTTATDVGIPTPPPPPLLPLLPLLLIIPPPPEQVPEEDGVTVIVSVPDVTPSKVRVEEEDPQSNSAWVLGLAVIERLLADDTTNDEPAESTTLKLPELTVIESIF